MYIFLFHFLVIFAKVKNLLLVHYACERDFDSFIWFAKYGVWNHVVFSYICSEKTLLPTWKDSFVFGKGVKIKKENMSLKFTALEVGSGDAFLLEDENRKILFDSGGSKNKIVALLRKKGITKIDLAICSHNDKDHSKGFLGLLNSKIRIGQKWSKR